MAPLHCIVALSNGVQGGSLLLAGASDAGGWSHIDGVGIIGISLAGPLLPLRIATGETIDEGGSCGNCGGGTRKSSADGGGGMLSADGGGGMLKRPEAAAC